MVLTSDSRESARVAKPRTARKCLALLLLSVVTVPMLAGDLAARRSPLITPIEVSVVTPDSMKLVGYLYVPQPRGKGDPPLVLLLHQSFRDHTVWKEFTDLLCERDFAVLAMDLRGYGNSVYDLRVGQNRPPGTFIKGDFERYPADVTQLVRQTFKLHGGSLDTTKLAVIGAELGANLAVIYAAGEPRVRFTGLISPGLDYKGLKIALIIREFGERPLFIATGSKDTYSYESCNLLSYFIPRVLDMTIYDTFFYGNMLLDREPTLDRALIDRLEKHLKIEGR